VVVRIQVQDTFHGAALTQIVEHPSFKALNRVPGGKYGHYEINNRARLFIKYANTMGPDFRFTLSPDDMAWIRFVDEDHTYEVFVVLVCGHDSICAVNVEELDAVLATDETKSQQIWVRSEPSKSMRFGGPNGALSRTIPHSRFPGDLLV
jgi:hypothetical protein